MKKSSLIPDTIYNILYTPAQQGQILVMMLLVMLVGLTMGMALMTRTTQDVAISNRIGESTQAFAAAEAGIERALKDFVSATAEVAPGIAYDVVVTTFGGDNAPYPANPQSIPRGEVGTFWLVNHDAEGNLAEVPTYINSSIDVCWGNGSISMRPAAAENTVDFLVSPAYAQVGGRTPPPRPGGFPGGPTPTPSGGGGTDGGTSPALIVSLLYKDMPGGVYKTAYGAFDNDSSRAGRNNFDSSGISSSGGNCGNLTYKKTITFSSFGGVASGIDPATDVLLVLRAIPVYFDAKVAVNAVGANPLPGQGMEIVSKGIVGVVNRQIRLVQEYSVPSSFFDIPLYLTGGSLIKN